MTNWGNEAVPTLDVLWETVVILIHGFLSNFCLQFALMHRIYPTLHSPFFSQFSAEFFLPSQLRFPDDSIGLANGSREKSAKNSILVKAPTKVQYKGWLLRLMYSWFIKVIVKQSYRIDDWLHRYQASFNSTNCLALFTLSRILK